MPGDLIELKGITWDHTRGYLPMVATAQRFGEQHPGIRITWEKRSLQEFADKPVEDLAARFDLLVIDHPWTGYAASRELFLPLDNYLPEGYLKDQQENSVGASFESYAWEGSQWALPIDAAAPVASSRPDIFEATGIDLPETFDDLLLLAGEGLVIFPGIPIDTLMNFYMFCSALGEDPFLSPDELVSRETGLKALQAFRQLALKVDPSCFEKNPIQVYETMTGEDRFAYCPFAYGYVNYSRKGYARKRLHFHELVSFDGEAPLKSTLGGTGLAVSATCRHREAAVEYAAYVASADCQKAVYFQSGGQPGHCEAWKDAGTNELGSHFFRETLAAHERAFLRPRYRNYMHFQDNAGAPLRDYLMKGGQEERLLEQLNQLYRESLLQ
ncbi:MAG TPA: extracellular solute-binding protein [Anseongella sp.]|nr:extracellular solute-binding protein [Anseongella sp.]